jgi:hypothetical protein
VTYMNFLTTAGTHTTSLGALAVNQRQLQHQSSPVVQLVVQSHRHEHVISTTKS